MSNYRKVHFTQKTFPSPLRNTSRRAQVHPSWIHVVRSALLERHTDTDYTKLNSKYKASPKGIS